MKTLWMILAALAITGSALIALQDPTDKGRKPGADSKETSPAGSCEIRVYMIDKEKKPVDLKEAAASLIIVEKSGAEKKTLPMVLVTPKADEKADPARRGQVRAVPGTANYIEFIVLKPAAAPERPTEKDRPLAPKTEPQAPKTEPQAPRTDPPAPRTQERPADPQARPAEDWLRGHIHTGPYLKAEIDRETTGDVSFVVTIKAETKTIPGLSLGPAAGKHREACVNLAREIEELERQVRLNEMERARTSADRLVQNCRDLPTGQGDYEKMRKECVDAAQEIQSAVQAGSRDKALEHLSRCKAKIAACPGCLDVPGEAPRSQPPKK